MRKLSSKISEVLKGQVPPKSAYFAFGANYGFNLTTPFIPNTRAFTS